MANTPEGLEKHRFQMAHSFWRRVEILPIEGTLELVRVRYERMFDRQPIYNEIAREQESKNVTPSVPKI